MANKDKDRDEITLDKSKEIRSKEISKMIGEGGLGARKYYNIKKDPTKEKASEETNKDE